MRPSSRTAILDAALAVAQRNGIAGVTLDAVAGEAGVSKGGLIYHFPSKEQLLQGLTDHITACWERAMLDELGMPFDEATPSQRLLAYIAVVTAKVGTAGELAVLIDVGEALIASWRALVQKWVPPADDTPDDVDRAVARLAVDGLWWVEATTADLDPPLRTAVLERIRRLAEGRG